MLRPSAPVVTEEWLVAGDCIPALAVGGDFFDHHVRDGSLFVGSAENNPAKPGFKAPDLLTSTEAPERMQGRRALLEGLEQCRGARHQEEWRKLHQRGFELATSPGPRQAFDSERENPRVRDRYGRNPLGQNLLLARRLVEAGVGFVTVNGWTGPAPGQAGGSGATRISQTGRVAATGGASPLKTL